MKYSIIIPVYNVEKYLENCINSILNQTYKNFELILVNDGSSDSSGEICNKYKKLKNIKIIHKKNRGASDARNNGIKLATGDYVIFVDGDDYLYNNRCLEIINKEITANKCDILQYKMVNYYEKNDKYSFNEDLEINNNLKYLDILSSLNNKGFLSISPCNKAIKLDIIKKNNIYFEVSRVAEDIDWSFNLYNYTNSIRYINENIYVYRRERKGSVSTSKNPKKSKDLLYFIYKWYKKDDIDEILKNIYLNFLAYEFMILKSISSKNDFNNQEIKQIKELEKNIFNYDKNPKVKLFCKIKKRLGLKLSYFMIKKYMKFKKRFN